MNTEVKSIEIVRHQLQKMEPQFKAALPEHITATRFTRVLMTAVQNNPDLMMADRQSLWNAAMRAAQDGLLPDGRDGAIVIYNVNVAKKGEKSRWVKSARWMPMVSGLLKKVRNSDELKSLSAHVVYENDKFFYRLGDDEKIEHEPLLIGERGRPKLVYAVAHTKDGGIYREIMTVAEVEKVRSVSRAKDGGPWTEWWEEMAKKTVIRRMTKRLPMSSDIDDMVHRDDDLYELNARSSAGGQEKPKSLTSALDRLAGDDQRQLAPPEADGQVIDNEPAPDDGLDIPESLDRRPNGNGWRKKMEARINACDDISVLFTISQEIAHAKETAPPDDWTAVEALCRQVFDQISMRE